MRRIPILFALATLLALPLAGTAQQGPVSASLQGLFAIPTGFVTQTAEMVPENLYGFQPTPEVRTMGQLIGHIADAQYSFCSVAAGEASPATGSVEQSSTTKADYIAGLEAAFAYCSTVHAKMTDQMGAQMRDLFGQQMAAAAVLSFNIAHTYEHYGNLVTYMRINGITPPSSMPAG
jgi:uncharacterized damage-inducible protein DinB